MTVNQNYEVSSEGAVRHWEIPYASLENATPIATEACEVVGTDGLQVCGTVLIADATDSVAIVDFTAGMIYRHNIRTVTTYNMGAESAWATIDIGDVVYYDNSGTMPANCFLSLAATNAAAQANSIFGYVVPADETDTFPKAAGAAGNTWEQAVMQRGAGA